ncbi:MAG: hypothetical protein KDB31_10645 [Microthrixaceae bacterium]|nr:hypothetical protein [Microthrixaceae bacterium]
MSQARTGGNARGLLEAIAEQRYDAAGELVARMRRDHPEDSTEELTNRMVRACARELAMAGALSGGAAASPMAGPASAAALLGTEGAMNAARLGELVMAIGILHGHDQTGAGDRALWLAAALGAAEATALGMTGMAARAGVRGGARLMGRLPRMSTDTTLGRIGAAAGSKRGPWALAALLPYGLGASVGAAGNMALAISVGRAATRYFASAEPAGPGRTGAQRAGERTEEIWDVEVVSETILEEP